MAGWLIATCLSIVATHRLHRYVLLRRLVFFVVIDEETRTDEIAGLGIAVVRLNGHNESTSGNAILQAMAVSATIWPILFAAVVGSWSKQSHSTVRKEAPRLG